MKTILKTLAAMYLGCGLLVAGSFMILSGEPIAEWGFEEWKFLVMLGLGWPVVLFLLIVFAGASMGQM